MSAHKYPEVSSCFCDVHLELLLEPMRRDNLLQHVREGGFGLSHLFVKQLVSRFFFPRNYLHFNTCIYPSEIVVLFFFLLSDCDGEPTRLVGFQKEGVNAVFFFLFFFRGSLYKIPLCLKKNTKKQQQTMQRYLVGFPPRCIVLSLCSGPRMH